MDSVATTPPPPGRLSITSCWPSAGANAFAKVRPIRSAAPPAEFGTTSRIGLVGQSAAMLGDGAARANAVSAIASEIGLFMSDFLSSQIRFLHRRHLQLGAHHRGCDR